MHSGSTVDLIRDKQLIKNISKSELACNINTNAGIVSANLAGHLPGYGEVWYHPEALTNLLSLHNMKK